MFQLALSTENAAFEEDPSQEVARILEAVAKKVRQGIVEGPCMDQNGNNVGYWRHYPAV